MNHSRAKRSEAPWSYPDSALLFPLIETGEPRLLRLGVIRETMVQQDPCRVHFRDPSFVNIQALRDMSVGGYVADLIQNLAMLDPILGGIDR